jgi:hypothetical protein
LSSDRSTISVMAMLGESIAKSLPAMEKAEAPLQGAQGPNSNSAAQLGVRPPLNSSEFSILPTNAPCAALYQSMPHAALLSFVRSPSKAWTSKVKSYKAANQSAHRLIQGPPLSAFLRGTCISSPLSTSQGCALRHPM